MTTSEAATVLVVEDERDLADTYARWLAEDHDVRTAYSGEAALAAMDGAVDVVLLDRRLPDITGSEVLARIREEGHPCRVALVTAVDPDFDVLEMPFDDYVVKPVLRSELREIVERLRALSTYDEQVRESFSLARKLESLEREKAEPDLEDHEEYRRVRSRFEELQDHIDVLIEDFEDVDFERLYQGLSGTNENVDPG